MESSITVPHMVENEVASKKHAATAILEDALTSTMASLDISSPSSETKAPTSIGRAISTIIIPSLQLLSPHLPPSQFNPPFWDILRCYHIFWQFGIHLDVSLNTMAFTVQGSDPASTAPPRGLFIDFDHATPEIMKERVPGFKTYSSMHSMPFMAMNLLNGDAKTPLYRHGLEAFLWSMVMYCALGPQVGAWSYNRLRCKWHEWDGSLPMGVYSLKKRWLDGSTYYWPVSMIMDLDSDAPPRVGPLPFLLESREAVFGVGIPFEGLMCSVLRCLITWTGMRKPEFHQEQDDRYYMQLVEDEFPCEYGSKEWMDFKLEVVPGQPRRMVEGRSH